MKISVISPNHGSGCTSVAILLGHVLSLTQNIKVTLATTGSEQRLSKYLGTDIGKDKTRTVTQIVKLLDAGAISSKDMFDYLYEVNQNLYVLDVPSNSVEGKKRAKLINHVFSNTPTDITICDVDGGLDEELTQRLLRDSDMIICVINPVVTHYDSLKHWLHHSKFIPQDGSKTLMLMVNNYDERVDALRNIATINGFTTRNTCKIHYCPEMQKEFNRYNAKIVVPSILSKYPPIISLNNDLRECCQFIMSAMNCKYRWEDMYDN